MIIDALIKAFRNPRLLTILCLGFSSGLPLLLIGSTLKVWLTESKVDLTTIGIFSMVGLPYTLKFIWSPLMDRFQPLGLGRRRSWLLITQVALIGALLALSMADPRSDLTLLAVCSFFVAFVSASQDIAVDAYRIEAVSDEEQGLASSLYILGYRFGMLIAGAGALFIADHIPWRETYWVMAGFVSIGVLTTLISPEPETGVRAPRTLSDSVIGPLKDFFTRDKVAVILLFVLLYKIGEQMASEMYPVFFRQIGFTKTEIAMASKMVAIWSMIAGGLVGGTLIMVLNLYRSLLIFAVLQGVAILLFSILAGVGANLALLATAVGIENFTSGMASAAYMAFMAAQTNRRFTATQFAILSSLMGVPRVIFNSATGFMAAHLGWTMFFVACTLITIPGMVMLPWMRKSIFKEDGSVRI